MRFRSILRSPMGGGRGRSTRVFFFIRADLAWRYLGGPSRLAFFFAGSAYRTEDVWNAAVVLGAVVGGGRRARVVVGRSRERQLQQKEETIVFDLV